jgi:microcystin-dependent protein
MPSTTRILDANVNGTVYTSNANAALEAIDTCHSGPTAPTDEVANGKLWLDTTTTPAILKVYNNATWEVIHSGTVDINAGTIDGVTINGSTIGATTPAAGTFTTLGAGNLVGQVAYFATSSAPTGWLKTNGALISRTTYAGLFSVIGTTFGVGDGSTTFAIPDLRGEFLRAWDDARGIDSGRAFGSAQTDAVQDHTHFMLGHNSNINNNAWNRFINADPSTGGQVTTGVAGGFGTGKGVQGMVTGTSGNLGHNVRSATENRPRNIAMLACIKF